MHEFLGLRNRNLVQPAGDNNKRIRVLGKIYPRDAKSVGATPWLNAKDKEGNAKCLYLSQNTVLEIKSHKNYSYPPANTTYYEDVSWEKLKVPKFVQTESRSDIKPKRSQFQSDVTEGHLFETAVDKIADACVEVSNKRMTEKEQNFEKRKESGKSMPGFS